ncbi:MAG: protein arginine kinase [Ruminococcus sp.]|nr:protein arginine kinase [Ruminococcus sp.]
MQNDVVISTRVRLARNLAEFPFPCKLNDKGKEVVIDKVKSAIKDSNSAVSNDFQFLDLEQMNEMQRLNLVEHHLVSPEFISNTKGRALLITKDNKISIMVNEEDHLRIQVINKGFDLEETYFLADKVDTLLDENLKFAFNKKLGYLTQCPTNLGTGMRASVMLHLPALQKTRAIGRITGNLSKLGLTIRGIYGEGSEPKGAMYQLSNQVTLGISEKAALENLKNITEQLVNQEKITRERLFKSIETKDTVFRSMGILKYAKTISHDEAMKLLSNVRLGVVAGEITDVSCETIDELFTQIQPAGLMVKENKKLTPEERDIIRAELIQATL